VDPPLQFDPQTDVVLFPGPGAKTAAELKAEGKTPRRVVIIDSSVRPLATSQRPLGDSHRRRRVPIPSIPSLLARSNLRAGLVGCETSLRGIRRMRRTQWQKGNGVMMSQLLSALPRMKLTSSRSAYWRHRPKGKGGVPAEAEGCSSIEALWFVCKEVRISRRVSLEGGVVVV
jgi:hypothetical protein